MPQSTAPLSPSVSVTEPGSHSAQSFVELALYRPVAQAVQLEAPLTLSVSVTEPGEQAAQSTVESVLY